MRKIYLLLFTVLFTAISNAQNVEVSTGGPVTNYTTLKAAFDAINAGTHTGSILIEIASNTTETASAILNVSGSGSASYSSVLIRPKIDGVVIASNFSTSGRGVIELNATANVTIDGDNPNTGGTNRNLTITNGAATATTYTSVIRIAMGTTAPYLAANNISISNCNINGSATARNGSSMTSTTGAENTTFGVVVSPNGGATVTAQASVSTAINSGATVNNLLVSNNAINQCARGIGFLGGVAANSSQLTFTNNVIGDQSVLSGSAPYTTPATTVYSKGIYVAGATSLTITGNTIKNILSYVATTFAAIELNSAIGTGAGTVTVSNNTISGIVNNNASASNGILVSSCTVPFTIAQNIISGIQTVGSVSVGGGISLVHSATANPAGVLDKNQISNIRANSTGGYSAKAIYLNGGNNVVVSNNFIWDIYAVANNSTTGTTFGTRGISVNAGTGHRIYHNTVSLSGSMGGSAADISACLSVNSTSYTGLDIRNNIFSNTISAPASAVHTCIQLPSSGTSSMNLTLNNNAYYSGSASNQYIGTTTTAGSWYTAANFNAASTSPSGNLRSYTSTLSSAGTNDNSSLAYIVAAPFNSASNLHINTGVTPTQLESSGATVGVTTDIDGQVRPGPAGSVNGAAFAPDLGADEFDGVFLDASPPSIVYTPLSFTCTTGDRTLTATITDASGVPVSGAGLPVLYWKINSGSYTAVTGVSLGGNQYQFTFGAGAVLSDVVSYYIVAQDMAATPNVVASPSAGAGGYTINPPAAATPPTTPSSYSISGNMSGNYNVGVGGDFATLTAAVTAYNTSCLTGPVVFSLTDASYSASETFPIVINANSYASTTNTLTIKPATGVAASITGSNSSTLLKLNGADYVTIDGLNSGGSSLAIQNTNSANTAVVIWIGSNATDGSTNNTIKNCTISGNTGTTTIGCILAGDGGTLGNAATAANSNNTIQGNNIKAAQNGIYISGLATTYDQNWLVTQNTIGSTSIANDKMSFRGVGVINCGNFVVSNNTINGVVSTTSSSSTMTGISVFTGISNGVISGNRISDIKQVNTTGWGSNGIGLFATTTASNLTIANNFVFDVASYGYNGVSSSDNGYGIMVGTGGGYNIYFNTVNMNTNQTATTGLPAAINISSSVATANSVNIRNNILSNTQTVGTSRYSIYCGAAASVLADINYNDYYYGASPNLGNIGGSDRANLAAWQTGTGKDTKSISYQPTFTSATDLHLVNTAGANWCLNGAGTTIAGITADIDNDTRATTPDIGADEFTATGFVVNNPAAVCSPATVDLTAAAVTAGSTAGLSYTYWTDAAATSSLSTPNAVAASGTYYIKASDGTCSIVLPVTVTVNTSPALYNVTGGGNYCSGGSGLAVGLSGSETGVDYQLYNGASPVGSPVAGSGAALSFGIQVTAGTYTVVATNTTTSCNTTMTGSATITVDPLPVQFSVTGGGSYCAGGTGVAIGLSGSESGVNYQLYNGASAVGSPVAGTGSAFSFGNQTAAGTYTVEAVNPTTTCSATMTGSATVTINPVQSVSGTVIQPTTCVSPNGSIDITVSGSPGAYTYSWSTADGSGLVAGQEDQSGLTVGQYTVVVTDQTTGCTQTAVFNLSGPGGCAVCPTVGSLTTNPASVACQNTPVTLTASGLVSMGITYGIDFKVSPVPLADPYAGGSVVASVNNAGLTGGGTTATTVVTPPDAGSFFLYAVLTPVPVDPACRPYAGIAVTVNPTPTVDAVSNQVVCNNGATTAVSFTGAIPGTTFNWTNTLSSIGLAASGTGNIPSFTATNTTNAPVTATVTVTPSTETIVGGTISQTFNYTGSAQTFTVPAGVTSITIDAYGAEGGTGAAGNSIGGATLGGAGGKGSKASGTLAVTPGQVLNIFVGGGGAIPTGGYNGGGTGGNINSGGGGGASDVRFPGATAGDRILVAAGGGGGGRGGCESTNLINGGAGGDGDNNGANGTDAPTSGGVAGAGGGGTLVAGGAAGVGCGGFLGQPGVAGLATGIGGNGGAGQSCCCFSFGSVPGGGGGGGGYVGGGGGGGGSAGTPGCSGNDKGAGGGGAGGSSYTGGVTAGAVTNSVQSGNGMIVISYTTATITSTCTGTPVTFTYTVNPTPNAVATPASQASCSGNAITTIALSGNVSGTTYSWTRDNTASVTGIAASGSGNISGTLTNTTTAPITVTFTITPTANGCTGSPITAIVVVNPIPNAVATPATQTVCTGTAITTIALTGNVSGTTYNWTRNNTTNVTGIAASGSGNISGTLTNTTTTQQTVTFTITPTANGCTGTPITATVIVNPTPTITCPANIVRNADAGICGAVVTYPPATATGTPTPTITYSVASGSTFPVGVTTVTATATNACGTVTCTFTVTVVDNQAPTITCPANVVRNTDPGLCTATFAPANPTTADNCAVTVLTWTMSGATTGSSPTTGINNLGSRTFNMGVTTVAYTVKDAAGNTSNCSFTVTINDGQLPTVSAQPVNRTVCAGTNATFSVTATNVVTYQWQQWNGTAWVNIAGATSSSYTVSSVTTAMNTNTFRVILNGLCTVVNSNAATLFVNPLPAITLDAAATASIWPNQTTTITATATPAGGTFVWTWNGSPVSGVTGAVLGPISIDRIGDYKVTYTDQNGCVNTSSVISITPAPSDNNLWVYPNPTMGQFNVRYFNQTGEKSTMRIYNAAGQMVFEQALSLGIAYSNTPVNLYHVAAGVYVVKIVASDGKVMAARSVAVYH